MRPRATSRAAIDAAALDLYLERGHARTSVADIAQRCGISRPTFFRYVSHRDAIVLDLVADLGAAVAGRLADEPGADWTALSAAVCDSIEAIDPQSPTGKAFRVLRSDPGIRSGALGLTRAWRAQLTEVLVERGDFGGERLHCEAAAAMAIGLSQMIWAAPEGEGPALREVFAAAPGILSP